MKKLRKTLSFGIGIASLSWLVTTGFNPVKEFSVIASNAQPDCVIKGNISHNTGKKLYHLPGMEDYENTVIDTSRGERWFCTEAEAIDNGWVKAPR